jgi:hypothetical protein
VSGSGDKTIAYANVTLRLATLPVTFDDFNGGNDTGWTRYSPVAGSTYTFPAMSGSGAYLLTSPKGIMSFTSPDPGRIGSYRMDQPARTKFHVEADLLNWSETKGQHMGVQARVQSPVPTNGDFPGGYALVLRVSKSGVRGESRLSILRINAGTTEPTVLNVYPDQGYNLNNGFTYPAPGVGGYRLIFWSDSGYLKGQIIDKNTGIPMVFYDGVSTMTNTLVVPDPGTYTSGTSGLFSYVRITNNDAQGVDPTFDNFYSGTDAPDTTLPSLTCPSNKTIGMDLNQNVATGVALGTSSTSDNSGGIVTVWNNAPTQYPIGVTTVHWYGYDPSGNVVTGTQTVTVNDTQAPSITSPADVTVPVNSGSTAVNVSLGTPVTSDNCSVASVGNNAPAAYPLGNTTVTWTVADGSGNTATGTQKVTAVWLSSEVSHCATQNGMFTFTWFGRKLQQTDDLSQPFTDVPGAVSPYSVPITPPRKFFRAW